MRSRSVFSLLAVVAAALLPARAARADEKQACSAAYDQTQALRRAGKLQAARAQAAVCTRDACAAFIRADCGKWLGEIDTAQPTVILRVRDAQGRDLSDVRVTLDGAPWLDHLDGRATSIDPGEHTLVLSRADGRTVEEKLLFSEGEKLRRVDATFPERAAPVPLAPTAPAAPPVPTEPRSPARAPIAPWIVGGVGLAALVAGGVMTGVLVHEKSITDRECGPATCSHDGASAASLGRTLGPITTATFIAGGAGVAAGAIWLVVTRPKPASPAVGMGPAVVPGGAGWRVGGAF